jgi:hypothetical protein
LAALQATVEFGGQKSMRGFWSTGGARPAPYVDPVYSALPPIAMLELADALPTHAGAPRWHDSVRLYLDEYGLPMSARSAYGVMPLGLFPGALPPRKPAVHSMAN